MPQVHIHDMTAFQRLTDVHGGRLARTAGMTVRARSVNLDCAAGAQPIPISLESIGSPGIKTAFGAYAGGPRTWARMAWTFDPPTHGA